MEAQDNAIPGIPKSLAVFVHGFGSDASCWDNLLGLLRGDPRVAARFDLTCFSYTTPWFNLHFLRRIPEISDIGQQLRTFLDQPSFRAYPEITLVGHSQGGLVIQSYLADRLVAEKGHELRRIRQVLLIATPNLGSTLLSPARKFVSLFFTNPQERALRVFNKEIATITNRIAERLVGAAEREPGRWPVPVQAFYGDQDRIVTEPSARGPFDLENTASIPGDHFSVIRPQTAEDPQYRILADALLEPAGHRHQYEIDRFEAAIRVEPAGDGGEFEVKHGAVTRIVQSDNVARVGRAATFSRKNRCTEPFMIRYRTKNQGYIDPAISHPNEAEPLELSRWDDTGSEYTFRFRPAGGETYSLSVKVYKGFDPGHRDVHFHLGNRSYYKEFRCTLDLTAYKEAGWNVSREPRLFFHPRDTGDHELCKLRGVMQNPLAWVEFDPAGIWRWKIHNIMEGVIDLAWDVAAPASARAAGGEVAL
jgi:pimeloyl-ACP methyl ester carboxylesterase